MPYKCSECDFASVYKDKYNTHVKIHLRAKGMTEEEANTTLYYYCDKCGKQFTNQYRHVKQIIETPWGGFITTGFRPVFPPTRFIVFF